MSEYIDREAMMDILWNRAEEMSDILCDELIHIEPSLKWIPFRSRELDEEEKADHPEWDCMMCSPLPDDGQRILVTIKCRNHEAVQFDEFYNDSDGCYLDSGYELVDEAIAWMPLPEPYKEDNDAL